MHGSREAGSQRRNRCGLCFGNRIALFSVSLVSHKRLQVRNLFEDADISHFETLYGLLVHTNSTFTGENGPLPERGPLRLAATPPAQLPGLAQCRSFKAS